MSTLLEVLSTPSEAVQRAVSNCLPPLMTALVGDRPYLEQLIEQLMSSLKGGANYGERCVGALLCQNQNHLKSPKQSPCRWSATS